ncbi:MAG: DUF86 domain-containing protein [Caulobacterales bacterium]|nr:DUF86 domain-containing protein [Caulobacterales bacterium]
MPSDRDRQAWTDIVDNARLALGFAEGMDAAAFTADVKTFYAATRCLEIISEAARRLSDDERARHPDLPWKNMTGAGNVYRHDYDDVEPGLVWTTIRDRLPALIAAGVLALHGPQE